jgi:hypothetical protein
MFLPYSTDAPIYYWPIATIGLIVVNVVIFFAVLFGGIQNPEDWVLVNQIKMFYWVFGFIMGTGEVPIMMLAGFYIGFDRKILLKRFLCY